MPKEDKIGRYYDRRTDAAMRYAPDDFDYAAMGRRLPV